MMTLFTKSVRRLGMVGVVAPMLLVAGTSCTDLSETPHNALTPETAFQTDQEILAGVAGVYATLRAVEWVGYVTIEDLSTDVSVVPTRGSDWYDNGQWLDLHRQTWTANSSGSGFLNGAWSDMFGAIAKENLMISVISAQPASAKADTILAELRTLRAFDYYALQDLFGPVPLVTTTELKQYARVSRDSVFKFIEAELLDARTHLPDAWPASYYGRVTKGTANAILASLYLNAGVFKDATPVQDQWQSSASANSYNSCAGVTVTGGDACTAAIAAANAVIAGPYSLSSAGQWNENFSINNHAAPENIFVVVHSAALSGALGGNWPHRTLHYHQLNADGGPWNGFATTAENFNRFDAGDERIGMWLVGPQRSFDNGQLVTDRNHPSSDTVANPLTFTTTIPDMNAANEAQGVRFNKYPPTPNVPHGGSETNDFTFFRLSEMYLIKAEAENELGQLAAALVDLAAIHDLRDPSNPVAGMGLATKQQVRDAILKERAVELSAEGKRRTDLIRMGHFLDWTDTLTGINGVAATARDGHYIMFPVPASQIASNPNLVQNSGY